MPSSILAFQKECHQDIAEKRPSHQELTFETCHKCHHYHDNTALNETFLAQNLHQAHTFDTFKIPKRNFLDFYRENPKFPITPLTLKNHDAPAGGYSMRGKDWEGSSHANAGVNCMPCHTQPDTEHTWVDSADYRVCEDCHTLEVAGFLKGKHGIRLAKELSPMTTTQARSDMKPVHKSLHCMSCHEAHGFNTTARDIGVESCLACHDDTHSRAYKKSPHYTSWTAETPESAIVSCATCHFPRRLIADKRILVEHNPNFNLHPNQKMLKDVCMICHGLGYSLDALADSLLVRNNFLKAPTQHLKILDMVEQKLNDKH